MGKKREQKALSFLTFTRESKPDIKAVCEGAVRDKRGRSRVSSALVRNKGECEKRARARNGWRMVSVRDCVVYVTY